MRLFLRSRIKHGAGFEDKQKSCVIWVVYLLHVTLANTQKKHIQFFEQTHTGNKIADKNLKKDSHFNSG